MWNHGIRLLGAALLVGAGLLLGSLATVAQSEEAVVIADALEPARLEIEPGTTVTWRNEDRERHRVRSRQGPVEFDSGNLRRGESFSFTFVIEGSYPYLDHRNDEDGDYYGTVVVRSSDVPAGALPTSASVTIVDESFQPPVLEVATGATVEWLHQDGDDQHTVTSTEGIFDSGIMEAGDTFGQSFETAGSFPYFCAIHPDMRGTITVSDPEGELPAAPGTSAAPVTPSASGPAPSTSPGAPAPSLAQEALAAEVSIVDFAFEPPALEVEVGTTVTWTNEDNAGHTATATEGAFDSGVMTQGETFAFTFDEPGTYAYFCAVHPSMQATITVSEPAASPGVAPPESGEESPGPEAEAIDEVAIIDLAFQPSTIEVPAGTTITWTNEDPFDHTVSATEREFDSGLMNAGEVYSRTFETPATFDYFCAIHPSMQGTVIVTDPGG